MKTPRRFTIARSTLSLLLVVLLVGACDRVDDTAPPADPAEPALRDVFDGAFLVGAALNARQVTGADAAGADVVARHFNTITPENTLKWESVHPEPGVYDWEVPDAFVAFGEANDQFIVGHTLVWHNQTPAWVFEDENGDPVDRETLLARMRDHIHTVVGRYKGRIHGWDVVNEAVDEDGSLRRTRWLEIIGEDYLAKAFEYAHEADPDAELYYNDYSLENEAKRAGAVRLIQSLLDAGAPITGVGLQGHLKMDWPTLEQEAETIQAFADLGLDVMITELDIDVLPPAMQNRGADITLNAELNDALNPYADALPDSVQEALAERYAGLFGVYLDHADVITRVTFWGVADGDSWLNGWPVAGRTSYPLLFDRAHRPKPAFDAVVAAAREHAAR